MDKTLCFTNVCLPSSKPKSIYSQIDEIHSKTFQRNYRGHERTKQIDKSDYSFLLGDFNFKIPLKDDAIYNVLRDNSKLFDYYFLFRF